MYVCTQELTDLAGVGDGADDAVGELEHHEGGVDVPGLRDGGVNLAVALGEHLLQLMGVPLVPHAPYMYVQVHAM